MLKMRMYVFESCAYFPVKRKIQLTIAAGFEFYNKKKSIFSACILTHTHRQIDIRKSDCK